ncbi:MAG: hypothetical protein L3K10_08600 [Thermoplasmata archaeon]|nr:hypothetical protein [Thermoplasmata archaeon]
MSQHGRQSVHRQKRLTYAVGAVALVFVMAGMMFLPIARADGPSSGVVCPSLTVAQVVNEVTTIPQGSHMILSVWWTFNHLEDGEFFGYFALDAGLFSFTGWQAPDGSFYGLEVQLALYQTYQGVPSAVAGIPEPTNGVGPFIQVNFFHITGLFTPGSMSTRGYIGSVNAGGSKLDVLNGTYANQVGNSRGIDLSFPYFNGYTGANYVDLHDDLAWDYHYFPNGAEYCGYSNLLTGQLTVAGDIVT